MNIRFIGEDENGEQVVYKDWRALAEADPFALLERATLTDLQRLHWVEELSQEARPEMFRSGDERVEMVPSPYSSNDAPLRRFAAKNLPILQDKPDSIALAKVEAIGFLEKELGAGMVCRELSYPAAERGGKLSRWRRERQFRRSH